MHTALRPYMTTGVALVGASVIAVTPISPPPDEIHMPAPRVSSASVELTAAFDPITAYTQLFTNTFNNLVGLGGEVLADPAPILRQVLTNSIGNAKIIGGSLQSAGAGVMTTIQGLPAELETARDQLSAGDFAGAVNTVFSYVLAGLLFNIGLPLIEGPATVVQNVAGNLDNVAKNGTLALLLVALAPIYPINATVSAFGALGQDILTSAGSGDFVGVVSDLVSAPAVLADAFLNGFPSDLPSTIDPAGGLLTTSAVGFGTIENMLQAGKAIAGLLTLPAPASSVTDVSTTSNRLITLHVTPHLKNGADVEDKSGQTGTDGAKTKSTLLGRLPKRANGATDLSDGNSAESGAPASAPAPRQRASAVVGGVQDKLTTKLGGGSAGPRTHLGKAGAANSGGDNSNGSGHADSGGAAK